MSGTGSLMIRNLRNPSDYSKGVMTQDELLRIAIANDANVAQARAGFQRGEVQELSPQQLKSPAELQADIALQEKTALDNLLRLFQYREASAIIGELNPDEIFTMNQSFPLIEREISKRFAKGLLSPTFFVEYLRKFKEELEQSKGVSTNLSSITNKFNTLTDNINDIRAILPTKTQFSNLQDYLEGEFDRLPRLIIAPLLTRIQRLQNAIPSSEDFRRVSADQEILQYETLNMLQNITANMPTQNQLGMIMEDIRSGRVSQAEGVKRIEDAISGVSDEQLDMLEDIKREIQQSRPGQSIPFDILAQITTDVPQYPVIAIERKLTAQGTPVKSGDLFVVYPNGNNERITLTKLKAFTEENASFRRWYADNVGGSPALMMLRNFILEQSTEKASRKELPPEKSGFGLKAKNGRIRTKKIGEGVKYEPEPTYRQFGKYVINIPQLKERDILNVKFPSLGRIPQFKPTPISDIMKEFLLELLDSGKVSNRIYEQIPIEERQLFEKIATGAGILNALKLKRTISNEDKEDNDRFTLLKGEYLAGNNSVALLKELRKLVVKFMSQGKISKHDGMNLLIELSV
jgi:hypothetical protein